MSIVSLKSLVMIYISMLRTVRARAHAHTCIYAYTNRYKMKYTS